MKYDLIDTGVYAWARQHSLHIYTEYKDDEVRTTNVMGSAGRKCQIWIDHPDEAGTYLVNVWNYKKKQASRIKQLPASKTDIRDKLEEAYKTAQEWLKE